MNIQLITVPVEVIGEYYVLLDKQGNQLFTQKIHRQRLTDVHNNCLDQITWNVAVRNEINKLHQYNGSFQLQTPWQRKFDSLAKSFAYRAREMKLPKTRKRFEQYQTRTWPKAVKRMIDQYRNCYVYRCGSPWKRWATCVCKNNNRRSMTSYGKNN